MPRTAVLLLALGLSLGVLSGSLVGCSKRATVTRTTEVVEHPKADGTVERETIVTKEETSRPTGVVSSGFDFLGSVIALPFKIIAGIFEVLF